MNKKNKIVGITFGSFDLFHYGHVLMFKECKEYCDFLVVGVQSDPSIDRPKKILLFNLMKKELGLLDQ